MHPPRIPTSATSLVRALVRIPSVNRFITGKPDAEKGVAAFLARCARAWGLKAELLPVPGVGRNLLITKQFRKGAPWIMAAAHMDTVSAEGMGCAPFGAEMKGGRIYGRGSCDDKGCIAAALWAMKQVDEAGGGPNNLALLATVDEEQRRSGALAFARAHLKKLKFRPAGVVVAEPTLLKPVIAHAGIAHLTVTARGRAAHASEPHKGRSAIRDMVKVMDALERGYIAKLKARHPLCGRAQCSINMIFGGRQVNAVPDECSVRVDRRVMPGESVARVLPDVRRVLARLAGKEKGLRVSAKMDFQDEPLDQQASDRFISKILHALKRLGLDSRPRGAAFATDAGALVSAGLSCVVLGPGDGGLAHTAMESIGVDELGRGIGVFGSIFTMAWD